MPWVAGVDACRAGWFVMMRQVRSGRVVCSVVPSFDALLSIDERPSIIAIDMPIGLLEQAVPGGRECDRQARGLLGAPRASSVFSPPVRQALRAATYGDACSINAACSACGLRLAKQCFGLFPKLREVDERMTPDRQVVIREAHPELCFYELNGCRSIRDGKKTRQGLKQRRGLLSKAGLLGTAALSAALSFRGVRVDDVLDAWVLSWTAERILRRKAVCVPRQPPLDSKGLRMEIWR